MKLKGDFDGGTSYSVGDVVRYQGVVYNNLSSCPAGTPPTDTRYWGRTNQMLAQCAEFILDMQPVEYPASLSESALILKSSTEGSEKEFLITVDDDGEITATELEEGR